ncbi:UTRA domain-containing protein [Embleya hyalina]|nr:UTRA domain-containing protein [Embleya hyalina]
MDGETIVVTAAGLVVPPNYIREMFQLDHGDQIVRRESVIGRGKTRTALTVTWHPVEFLGLVPDLVSTAVGKAAGLTDKVLTATGRKITHGRDDMHARTADAREASHLGVPIGASILGLGYRWSDEAGIIEFGEVCLPSMLTIGYPYELAD